MFRNKKQIQTLVLKFYSKKNKKGGNVAESEDVPVFDVQILSPVIFFCFFFKFFFFLFFKENG